MRSEEFFASKAAKPSEELGVKSLKFKVQKSKFKVYRLWKIERFALQ